MKHLSRREFMVDSALLAGGAFGAVAMGSGVFAPQKSHASDITFPETQCGIPERAGIRILVGYASFCGTTGYVADAIGQTLCEKGASVDVRLLKNVTTLDPYGAVVLGSATRSASWWPEAIDFVETNREILGKMPVAYFLTCLALVNDSEGSRRVAKSYMDPVLNAVPEVRPVDMGFFAGVLDYGKMNLMYSMVMKVKMMKRGIAEGDYRNWTAIRTWAEKISPELVI